MLRDHVIPKPETLVGYKLHQLVEGLTEGDAPLFLDRGNSLLIRTAKEITETGTAVEIPSENSIIGFELRACVSKKVKGKHHMGKVKVCIHFLHHHQNVQNIVIIMIMMMSY